MQSTHAPLRQAPEHTAWVVHLPSASQRCKELPLHCTVPTAHSPVQTPPTHAFGHAALLCHAPLAAQVCGTCPLHCFVSGRQSTQVPLRHAPEQVVSVCQRPCASQRCTVTPLHRRVPSSQAPEQASFTQAFAQVSRSLLTRSGPQVTTSRPSQYCSPGSFPAHPATTVSHSLSFPRRVSQA